MKTVGRRYTNRRSLGFLALLIAAVLFNIALLLVIGWVSWHFVSKWW